MTSPVACCTNKDNKALTGQMFLQTQWKAKAYRYGFQKSLQEASFFFLLIREGSRDSGGALAEDHTKYQLCDSGNLQKGASDVSLVDVDPADSVGLSRLVCTSSLRPSLSEACGQKRGDHRLPV